MAGAVRVDVVAAPFDRKAHVDGIRLPVFDRNRAEPVEPGSLRLHPGLTDLKRCHHAGFRHFGTSVVAGPPERFVGCVFGKDRRRQLILLSQAQGQRGRSDFNLRLDHELGLGQRHRPGKIPSRQGDLRRTGLRVRVRFTGNRHGGRRFRLRSAVRGNLCPAFVGGSFPVPVGRKTKDDASAFHTDIQRRGTVDHDFRIGAGGRTRAGGGGFRSRFFRTADKGEKRAQQEGEKQSECPFHGWSARMDMRL